MLKIGEKFGHYKVHSAIGSGGMGEIYRAHDTRLKRDVAIKILPEKWMLNTSAVERFMREAYAASALNHPNILTIYDIGKYENTQFITTEFVEGETLRARLKSAPLSLSETLDVAVQVAGALAAAHNAGIVHRDIKPENIMLRADGYVKVLDFGIAKLTEHKAETASAEAATLIKSLTDPGMILGTALYMSPEQARGLNIDARSDIFSLGVVIYEMITGTQPFSGATLSDIIAAVLKSEPKPISDYAGNTSSEFEWCVGKALNKEIENRYQTIKELLTDLNRIKKHLEFETVLQHISESGVLKTSQSSAAAFSRDSARTAARKKRKAIDSLAVLPLVNSGNDSATEYLSDGITEFIINSLSSLPKLRVVPRSTVFRYKDSPKDAQEIGEELSVRAVLAGRIMQISDSLIVKTELIDIANEAQLWGEQYRHEMTDIFALQAEIARDISEKLKLKLTGEQKKRLVKNYTDNTEAYQFYLKGRYFVTTKRTENWIKKGIEYFQKAIDLDPNYALAYAGIAEAYGFLSSSTGGWHPRKAYPKAKAAALKALELDDTLGEAHCSLGFFRLLYDWNFKEAESEFKRAIELSPNYPNAHDGYGFYLKAVARHEEAIEKCQLAQQLDPLSPFAHVSLGYAYYFARNYGKAIEECNKALEMDRYSFFAYRNLGLAYLQQENFEKSIGYLSKAATFSGGGSAFESYLGFAYALAGKKVEALEILANLEESGKERYVPAYNFAIIYAGLRDFDKAFEWLEKALRERSGFLPFLKVEPTMDCLRDDPRFEQVLQRIGLNK